MRIIESLSLVDGHKLLLVETSCSGGKWGRPGYLTLVETDGTQYVHARGRNVVRVIARKLVDRRHTGPRSYHFLAKDCLRERMCVEASDYRPRQDAYQLTNDDIAAMAAAAGGAQ